MTVLIHRSAVLLWLMFFVTGCHESSSQSNLQTVPVEIGNQVFTLEIANTNATRQQGLMYRESMPADHGMVFVFTEEAERAFWMKNTKIPLDIIYLNSIGGIVSIKQMKPLDTTSVHSDYPAQYAIELNLGAAEKTGAKVGHVIKLPPVARMADE